MILKHITIPEWFFRAVGTLDNDDDDNVDGDDGMSYNN